MTLRSLLNCTILLATCVVAVGCSGSDAPQAQATPPAAAAASSPPVPLPPPPDLKARSFIVIDHDSGRVLAALEPDSRQEPASLTKLMTAYVVFHALKQGRIKLDDLVTVSENAWRQAAPKLGGSAMYIEVGKQISVENLLQGMIVQSGNDATLALAEYVGGTEPTFVQMMNSFAKQLGLTGSHFTDSAGMPNPEQYITARDAALLKVPGRGYACLRTERSTVKVGTEIWAIGNPVAEELARSVTRGVASGNRTIRGRSFLQTDAAVNPGNSGGPLLDASGNVIGINTAVAGDSQGIGFAIPINIARPLLAQASAGQPLARPWLGVQFQTIDPAVKAAADLPVDNGAWIPTEQALTGNGGGNNGNGGQGQDPFGRRAAAGPVIVPGSPAEQAGLEAGDIITAVNGQALDGQHPLDLVTSQLAPGQTVTLEVLRDGQTLTIQVTLGTRPSTS